MGDSAQLAEKQNHRKIIVVLDNAHFTMYKSSARLVVDRMEELIVELLLVENVWFQQQSWSFMHLLCSGMVGFDLRQNLGTAGKEHPSSEGRRGTGVLHQSNYKQMAPFTFTDP